MNYILTNKLVLTEKDKQYSKNKTTINYYTDKGDFKGLKATGIKKEEKYVNAAKWIAIKERFFTIGIDSFDTFQNVKLTLSPN